MFKYVVLKGCSAFLYLLVSAFSAHAQQSSFIHIQSENNQPFLVRLSGNTYSSSSTGYLVIPQVPAGEQNLVIGFPENQFPDYRFQCLMTDKPLGFSLKQSVDNSWSLFDMVNFTVLKGTLYEKETAKEPMVTITEKPVEPVLTEAKAVEKPIVREEPKKPVTPPQAKENKPVVAGESTIRKIFDRNSSGGIDQVYVVINAGIADTVALFIPELVLPVNKQSAYQPLSPKVQPSFTMLYGEAGRKRLLVYPSHRK